MSESNLKLEEDLYPSHLSEAKLEEKDLTALRIEAETRTREAINWYIKRKRSKATWSKFLRISAIVMIFVGGLSPILQGIGWFNLQDCQYGYIALALAAVCIVLDKFMGFSSSWMRYMTTAVKLQRALADFQTDWILIWSEVQDNSPTTEQRRQLLKRIKDFRLKMLAEIEQETQMWTHEFQSNLAQLERVTQTPQESLKPGILDLNITHGHLAEQGLTVMIDGLTVAHTRGERVQIGHILPGQHDVKVHGIVNDKEIYATSVVNMIAGTTVELKLSLPVNSS